MAEINTHGIKINLESLAAEAENRSISNFLEIIVRQALKK